MTNSIEQLARTAGQLANAGRWSEAEQTWREVHRLDPTNLQALTSLGIHALQRNDVAEAARFLDSAAARAPTDFMTFQALVSARQRAGDAAGEHAAIERALTAEPYFLPALLARGSLLERHGTQAQAAAAFANALKVAPASEQYWPPQLAPALTHAKQVAERHAQAFAAFLDERLKPLRGKLDATQAERWNEARSVMAGLSRPYHVDANQLYVPRLPAIPFYDPAQFPWVAALEAKTGLIREELTRVLATQENELEPYIAYRPGDPVNQWKDLNHSKRWATYHLYRAGTPVDEHLARCPETAKALAGIEMADIGGLCPNAMFSALAPHTQIPPHHGETNARLVVHLPLIVPANCTYRVGFERREWEVGKVLIFDDTLEHEARNDSDELRVVLIFDVWNPLLSAAERGMVRAMTEASREFAART
jgi:aspartate beta-hydroxylase